MADTNPHPIATTKKEYMEARMALLKAEKEATAALAAVAAQRRALPWEALAPSGQNNEDANNSDTEAEYVLTTSGGRDVSLSEIAGTTPSGTLLVYHLMFGDTWDSPCSFCSMWLDSLNGGYPHLLQKTAFVAVSPASPEKLAALKEEKGWTFPLLSSQNSAFSYDFGVRFSEEEVEAGTGDYNFGRKPFTTVNPGVSTFQLQDGHLFHTYSTYARGLEPYTVVFSTFDGLPFGRNETRGMDWTKHKNQYSITPLTAALDPQ